MSNVLHISIADSRKHISRSDKKHVIFFFNQLVDRFRERSTTGENRWIGKGLDVVKHFVLNLLNRSLFRLTKDLNATQQDFRVIHNRLVDGSFKTKNIQKDYRIIKKMIHYLTRLDESLDEANYFENDPLKAILKDTLGIAYQIEAEVKMLVFKSTKTDRTKDDLFGKLAEKSKASLSRNI